MSLQRFGGLKNYLCLILITVECVTLAVSHYGFEAELQRFRCHGEQCHCHHHLGRALRTAIFADADLAG